MNERFHRAAKDGFLDPLKQATKKDLNQPDDDGYTPTLWAAYHGNLDALRLCCSRGGDPDKCDYTGNTALHFAASNGYTHCLTFLVSFGANVWQMDNDFHTPMDLAGIREKTDCVRYLDGVIAKQKSLDNKVVKKLQEKAKKDAEKRIEKYEKRQQRQQKKLAEFHKQTSTPDEVERNRKISGSNQNFMTFSQATINNNFTNASTFQKKPKDRKKISTTTSRASSDPGFKISGDERRTTRSLAGIQSKEISGVMYMPSGAMSTGNKPQSNGSASKRKMLRNVFPPTQYTGDDHAQDPVSHTFGTMALRSSFPSASAMYSALQEPTPQDSAGDPTMPSFTRPEFNGDTVSSTNGYGSNDDFSDDDYNYMNGAAEPTPLDTFLASLNLSEYSKLFKDEKMDMESLMLCNIEDLKELEIPLGPRKKIMSSLEERKAAIHSPSEMELTRF